MKKNFTLFKGLLVALGLLGGVNAWAETVGANDNTTGYLAAHSTIQTIASGGSMHYVFTQSKATDANSKGWFLWVGAQGADVTWANGISIVRGDNWDDKWPNGDGYGANTGCTSNFNWDTFNADMNGATVDMTITYASGAFNMSSTITPAAGGSYTYSYAKTIDGAPTSVDVCLSVNEACLNITTAVYSGPIVKMTYVNYSDPDTSYGEIAWGNTARSGYNNITNNTVGFPNTGWGVNYITYLQVDASYVPEGAAITGATLTFDQSGATDGRRTTGVGVGYNASPWSSTMTYNTANKSITTFGDIQWTSTKSASTFERKSVNILPAFEKDEDNIVTIVLYETAAAGCYIKNPAVAITYTVETVYNVTFSESNGVEATVKMNDVDVTSGTSLVSGDYTFTATAPGYHDYEGGFTVSGADKVVEFTMTAKTPVTSITVNYVNGADIVYSEAVATTGKYVGEKATIPFRMYVTKDGKLYKTTANNVNPNYGDNNVTLEPATVVTKSVTAVDLAGGVVAFFKDLDGGDAENAGIRASYCSAYNNTAFTSEESLESGVYKFIIFNQDKGRGSSVKVGDETVFTQDGSNKGAWRETVLNNIVIANGGNVSLAKGSSNTIDCYDVIIAIKTADGQLSLNAYGYSTFSHSSAVKIEGATAYTATVDEGNSLITLTAIENGIIPANTGVILKGEASASVSYVTVADVDPIASNDLHAAVTAIVRPEGNIFVLSGDAFQALASSVTKLTANKAYLVMSDGFYVPTGANLRVVFAGEATGIANIEAAKAENGAVFNMAGQRVNGSYKGIVIKNGKKVWVK